MSDAYDPQEPEGPRRSNQYVSRKDVRVFLIVVVVLAIAGWPIYLYLLAGVNRSLCEKNYRKIGSAMLQYSIDFDDHLPYAYETADYNSTEIGLKGGYAFTWQWTLNRYVNDWSVFRCPSAEPEENTLTSDGTSTQASSYGMLNAYSGAIVSTISNPGSKFLICETSKNKARRTFDPLPLQAGSKPLIEDGFVVGFDNDADNPNPQTRYVTRLALPGSGNGSFTDETQSRHPNGINFLFVDGHVKLLDPTAAHVILLSGGFGSWDVPKPAHRF